MVALFFEEKVKKTKKIKKLTLKNLKVSSLESREAPVAGGWCVARMGNTCSSQGSGSYVGLDAPPEFQAATGGLQQPAKLCTYLRVPPPGSSCVA